MVVVACGDLLERARVSTEGYREYSCFLSTWKSDQKASVGSGQTSYFRTQIPKDKDQLNEISSLY